jgi:hypothetical protein
MASNRMKFVNLYEQIISEEESRILSKHGITEEEVVRAGKEFNNEEVLNESVGVLLIISTLLAAPKIIELLGRGISKVVKLFRKIFKKNSTDGVDTAKRIIEFSHKWHNVYIKLFEVILSKSGILKKAGITDKNDVRKAAEVVYYTVVAGLAVASGVGSISAFKAALQTTSGSFSMGVFEAVMAAVKSAEVRKFLTKVI